MLMHSRRIKCVWILGFADDLGTQNRSSSSGMVMEVEIGKTSLLFYCAHGVIASLMEQKFLNSARETPLKRETTPLPYPLRIVEVCRRKKKQL